MSTTTVTSAISAVESTPGVIRDALDRGDVKAVVVVTTVGYLLAYLWMIGDLILAGGREFGITVVPSPLERMVEPGPGTFTYEGIAIVTGPFGTYLFSPLNLTIATVLALLVGLNLGLAYMAIRHPTSCGISAGSGVFSAVPALVAGGACCAPTVLLALGVTASGTMMTVFPYLLPLGTVLLVASLVYLAGVTLSKAPKSTPA